MSLGSNLFSIVAFSALVACGVNSSNAQVTSADVETLSVTTEKAAAGTWAVRAEDSSVTFTGKQTGDEFTGEFKDFTAEIVFDPENLSAASVRAVIDMSSFDAGDNDRNDALPGKEWFSVKKFPDAVFTADEFTTTDTGYAAAGELSLRGVSLPVTLPFELSITDGVATMNGELVIDRSDFGVGQGAWAKGEWVDLNVTIGVAIVADAN